MNSDNKSGDSNQIIPWGIFAGCVIAFLCFIYPKCLLPAFVSFSGFTSDEGANVFAAFGNSFGALSTLFTGIAFVVGGLAIWLQKKTLEATIQDIKEQKEITESKTYLDKSVEYADKAYQILGGEKGQLTQDRMAWVSAARIIKRTIRLSENITINAHKNIYEAERDFQRHNFLELLGFNERNCIDFYHLAGSDDLRKFLEGKKPENKGFQHAMVPHQFFATVYRFAKFPENYDDPLTSEKGLNEEELELIFLSKGQIPLLRYLLFNMHFTIIGEDLLTRLPMIKKDKTPVTKGDECQKSPFHKVSKDKVNQLLDKEIERFAPYVLN